MKSYFNLLTFFPNIIKDAIAGVTSWLLGLFGFDEAAKTVANAQNFSLGDMLFNVIESIWLWFKDLLGIDVAAIAKMIPGAETLLNWMSGDTEKKEEAATKKLGGLMTVDKGLTDDDQIIDIKGLQAMTKGMSLAGMKNMMDQLTTINDMDTIGDEISNWDNVQKMMLAQMEKAEQAQTVIILDNSQIHSNSFL